MGMTITYPHTTGGHPLRLSRREIQNLAAGLRGCMGGLTPRPMPLERLAARMGAVRINGQAIRIAWDWAHPVHDDEGVPVFGACEYDPAEPGMVMISLNGELLADRPALLRSTAAHELGHAIFDMPASMRAARRRAYRLRDAPPPVAGIDWPEWRADEFMGEFLCPRRLLEKAITREAASHSAAMQWRVRDGIPRPMLRRADAAAIDSIIGSLAEQFGLSAAFIARRCARHEIIGA